MTARGWQFWIDRGGTFTDIIGRDPDGCLHARKLLSDNPSRYADAAVAGIRAILDPDTPDARVDAVKMGTTVATNALLEREGTPTVFVVTAGFGDALRIGYQDRPELFALDIRRPGPLHARVIEAKERLNSSGNILTPLDTDKLRADLSAARQLGLDSIAICFLHAHRFPIHERLAGELAVSLGFGQISLSHETSPLPKLVSRGDTTVADAYLSPLLYRYLDGFRQALQTENLRPMRIQFMQSNGGLADGAAFRGKDSVLSGPAGGVVGMTAACRAAGGEKLIGFDMGGTSTDVSLYDGGYELVNDNLVAGVRLRAPMIRIHTVAAGGGSVLRYAQGRFQAGPASAGADPGPASYGRGGPLAVTDANLVLGRLLPERFPRAFGPDSDQPLDRDAALAGIHAVAEQVHQTCGERMSVESVAEGFLRIAVDNMANAIKTVSTQRGYDPEEFTLCCFGGAGGQHACEVAAALGIRRILIHPLAGLLSAFGMGAAPLRAYRQRTAGFGLTAEAGARLGDLVDELGATCARELAAQGVSRDEIEITATLLVRVPGSDTTLPIPWLHDVGAACEGFARMHRQRFGFAVDDTVPLVEALRVEASGGGHRQAFRPPASCNTRSNTPATAQMYCAGEWRTTRVYDRPALQPGTAVAGPAIVADDHATTVVMPDWTVTADSDGLLILAQEQERAAVRVRDTRASPVLLELFNNHCMNIAEQMGAVLENTAHSVNIKERRDFSCALFDGNGQLVANAPHIPVHLGSMSDSVRAVLTDRRLQPGESWMLNDPYQGGTHLPDITVVTPFFPEGDSAPLFLLASRAHHADVGGMTPGSMPAASRRIEDEGVRFAAFLLVGDGRLREPELLAALASGPYPARNPQQNLADLRAQLAANEKGLAGLHALLDHFGEDLVRAYLGHVQDNAESAVRAAVRTLSGGTGCARLDDGGEICVQVTSQPDTGTAVVDFAGTSGASVGNLNAPRGITHAAVLYVFRCLVTADIPLNEGCLRPLDIRIPPDTLLSPVYPAAVAAGNVETSQCIANALFQALGVLAAGQGTMNNLSFGDARYQYYETIGGGAGAGQNFDGASGVHTHMTNSRITDPEILEERFPVLVREFALRRDSGGAGSQRGGNGLVRAIEILAPMHAAIVANHRTAGPAGLAGGGAGKAGINMVVRADGSVEYLPGIVEVELAAGDMLVIATPGGGGYGAVPAEAGR